MCITRIVAIATIWFAFSGTTASAAEIVALENIIETSSDVVPLPSSVPSTFVFKGCPTCTGITLRIDAATQFFAGTTGVSLAELNRACGSRVVALLLGYRPQTQAVTRFFATCEPPVPATDSAQRK